MEKELTLKTTIIGGRPELKKELVVLGRTVAYTEPEIRYEADEKHAKQLLKDMNMEQVKAAVAPGCKVQAQDQGEEVQRPLSDREAKAFRAAAARCNYLAGDRPV